MYMSENNVATAATTDTMSRPEVGGSDRNETVLMLPAIATKSEDFNENIENLSDSAQSENVQGLSIEAHDNDTESLNNIIQDNRGNECLSNVVRANNDNEDLIKRGFSGDKLEPHESNTARFADKATTSTTQVDEISTQELDIAALILLNSSELSEPIQPPATKQQVESAYQTETDVATEHPSVKAIEIDNTSEKSCETVCLEDITSDKSYRLDWANKKANACGAGINLEIYPYMAPSYNNSDDGVISEPPLPMTADEVLEHLRKDKNGAKFIQAIESGDISGFDTNDRSRIDFSVIYKLCFYCLNPDVIREILMNSHLRRDKWNTMRGNVTYLDYIIALALRQCTKHYHPSKKNKQGTQL